MATVYLSLGSNLGNRMEYLEQARAAIEKDFDMARFSKIYETEPVELKDQPWFLNQVVEFQTDMDPESLLEWVRFLENQAGRQRKIPKGPRTLDVDILLYDDLVQDTAELVLPHPRINYRRYVLEPMADLAPERRLPNSQQTVKETLEQVVDSAKVTIFP